MGHRSVIREDIGTENVRIAAIQRYLRNEGGDSWSMKKSFLYGRSVANQEKSNCSSFCCNSFFFINSKKENTKKKVAPEKKKRAKGKKVFPKRKYDAVRAYVWHKEGSVRLGF